MSRSTFLRQNAISLFFLTLKGSAVQRACALLLLVCFAASLRPTAIAQSVRPPDTQVRQAGAALLATKGLTKTGGERADQETGNATGPTSQFNVQAQTACETEMLDNIGAHEVFSGKVHEVLTEIAPA